MALLASCLLLAGKTQDHFEISPKTKVLSMNRVKTSQPETFDVVRILLAILLPPLGVFLEVGIGFHFWLNIVLTIFGYIPGIVHAIYVIVTR